MKPKKMTDEQVTAALSRLAAQWPLHAAGLSAHIAALEAERDEARDGNDCWRKACSRDGDANPTPESTQAHLRNRELEIRRRDEMLSAAERREQESRANAETWRGMAVQREAERDDMRMKVVRIRDERDTLRERVKALEKDVARFEKVAKGADLNWLKACERADAAESHLAAIRKRAKKVMSTSAPLVPVLRFVLGDDIERQPPQTDDLASIEQHRENEEAKARPGTAEAMPLTLGDCKNCEGIQQESCAAHPTPDTEGRRDGRPPAKHDGPCDHGAPCEPSTAEAFATVRRAHESWGRRLDYDPDEQDAHADAVAALSLLERRMGAMELVIRDAIFAMETEEGGAPLARDFRAALIDAPSSFTLEEVVEMVHNAWSDIARQGHMSKEAGETLNRFRDGMLSALRR